MNEIWRVCARVADGTLRALPVKEGEDATGQQASQRHGEDAAVGGGLQDVGEKAASVCIVGYTLDEAKQMHEEAGGDASGHSDEDDEEPKGGRRVRLRQIRLQRRLANR